MSIRKLISAKKNDFERDFKEYFSYTLVRQFINTVFVAETLGFGKEFDQNTTY